MKKNYKLTAVTFLLLSLVFLSFSRVNNSTTVFITQLLALEPVLPTEYYNYANIALPDYYTENKFPDQFQFQAITAIDNTPSNNQITDAGATLGRVLFYDEKLSGNGTVSCASCHQSEHGFSDPDVLSKGFEGGLTGRHSMGIVNARYNAGGKFFWDERAATLEDQVLMPFQDDVEMGLTLEELVQITQSQTYYPSLFKDAFGDETITSDRISKALAQFIRSMVSVTSKYDIARQEVQSPLINFPSFTDQENLGKSLFYLPRELTNGVQGNCLGCHQTEAFIGPSLTSMGPLTTFTTTNGLDAESTDDLGVYETTNNTRDIGKFKTPSLKNIAIRPPYMHDGRFATLEEVIEHYSSGIQNHQNLISPLVNDNGEVGQFNFTDSEKEALVAFLKTLTDEQMITDPKYSNPFEEALSTGTSLYTNNGNSIICYPNPVGAILNIDINSLSNESIRIDLLNVNGHNILNITEITPDIGFNKIEWDKESSLVAGIYILKITQGEDITVKKIILH